MAASKTVAVIMAGGSGTRFWPASRPDLPKQFLKLVGAKSLIQETFDRISAVVAPEDIHICAGASQKELFARELPSFKNLILEPEARNTAPCLMLSLHALLKSGYSADTVMVVLPADHHIQDTPGFEKVLKRAIGCARETGGLLTLGIVPTGAHTGYGYIEAPGAPAEVLKVKRFVEKPSQAKAEEFLEAGHYYWNSGMFVWTLGALEAAFAKHTPADWQKISAAGAAAYKDVSPQPIDVAVMEKAQNIFVVPADIGWSDVGSWDALYQLRAKKPGENIVLSGQCASIESHGCLVKVSSQLKIALVGVSDLVIVEDKGSFLIVPRAKDQLVREAAKALG